MNERQVLFQASNLPEPEQLKIKSILTDTALFYEIHGGDLQGVFLDFIKKANDLSYKTRQCLMRIWQYNHISFAITQANDSYMRHITDKKEIDAIENEIHRYFKPKGWLTEFVKYKEKDVGFYVKSVKKDGLVYRTCVMIGVENNTNQYIVIKLCLDVTNGKQVGVEEVIRFSSFKELKENI